MRCSPVSGWWRLLLINTLFPLVSAAVDLTADEQHYLQQHPTIRFVSDPDFAPIEFVEAGQLRGITVDILEEIRQQLNIQVELILTESWGETMARFERGEADVLTAMSITPELEQRYRFTQPLLSFPSVIVGRRSVGTEKLKLPQLAGERVLVVAGWPEESYLRQHYPEIEVVTVTSTQMGLRQVANLEFDYLFGHLPSARYYIQQLGLYDLTILGSSDHLPVDSMMLHRDDVLLQSILNKAISAIPPQVKQQIFDRWIGQIRQDGQPLIEWQPDELAYLQQKSAIKMCVDPDWSPLEWIDQQGQHVGVSADVIALLEQNSRLNLRLVPTKSWQQSLDWVRTHQCDMLSLAMATPEREKFLNFTTPYLNLPLVIATRNSEIFVADTAALADKRISLTRGYAYINLLRTRYPQLTIVEVDNLTEGLNAVRTGRVYGHADALGSMAQALWQGSMSDLKISGKLDEVWALSIATRNDEPLLQTIMQKALDTVDPNDIKRIYNQWLPIRIEKQIDYQLLYQLMALFALIGSLVLWRFRTMWRANRVIQQKNSELQQAYEQYSWLADNMDDVICVIDVQGRIRYISPSVEKLLGFTPERLLQRPLCDQLTEQSSKRLAEAMATGMRAAAKGETPPLLNLRLEQCRQDGSTLWSEANLRLVVDQLSSDNRFILLFRDITENIDYENALQQLVVTDRLTGLFNRHKLDDELNFQQRQQRGRSDTFGVLLIDIDHFKRINDEYGHQVGDVTLCKVANILSTESRSTDVVGRWGGEEFMIIISGGSDTSIQQQAERLRLAIATAQFEQVGQLTVSIGGALHDTDEAVNLTVSRADEALYEAKRSGRNRCQWHFQ